MEMSEVVLVAGWGEGDGGWLTVSMVCVVVVVVSVHLCPWLGCHHHQQHVLPGLVWSAEAAGLKVCNEVM